MDNIRKGNITLEVELSSEARDKLVATLLRIYPKYTSAQLTALVSKPKPLALIKSVDEDRATRFVEALRAQGVPLQFVLQSATPPVPAQPAPESPAVSTVSPSTEPPPQVSPPPKAPATAPGISNTRSPTDVSPPSAEPGPPARPGPAGSIPARSASTPRTKPGVKQARGNGPGSGKHSPLRTTFRRARIAILSLLLLATMAFAFQVYVLKVNPFFMLQVAQDKLNSSGLVKPAPLMEGGPVSEVLQVLYTPPPSVLTVDTRKLPNAYHALLKARPDRRFLLGFDSLTRRRVQAAGVKPGKYTVQASIDDQNQVILNLLKGKKVLHRTALGLPASFPTLMNALEQWNTALDDALGAPMRTAPSPILGPEKLAGARQLVEAVDPRFALMGLNLLEEIYREEGGHPELFLEAARAYATLCFLLKPDETMQTDELAAEALAFLAMAKHLEPEMASDEAEAFLAAQMGYRKHALELLERSGPTGASRHAQILSAYLKEDLPGLRKILENTVPDTSQVLGEYLHVRLLRDLSLGVEAEEAAMGLIERWPLYPAVLEVIHTGDLNLAKVLTILYPLDILATLEARFDLEALSDDSLEERFQALEGKSENDVINIARFEELLAKWDVFDGEREPLLFLDTDRVKRVFGIMYMDALYFRFNLLLNRWGVSEYARTFASSVAAGSENVPLAHYMQGMAAWNMGDREQARQHFRAILKDPASRKLLAGGAYLKLEGMETYEYLPHVYMQLDGRPWDRSLWGQILKDELFDLDGSQVVFREALEQNPYLYHLYREAAEASGSDSPLTTALQNHPYSYALLFEAATHFKARNDRFSQEKALDYYSRALEMAPSRQTLASQKGQALKRLQRYEEAAQVYTRWIEEYGTGDLGEVIMKMGRAEALRKMGRPEEALESMEGGEESYQAGAMMEAARCYEEMGKYQDAAEWFFRAAERYENSSTVAVECARFLWARGEQEAAAKMLQRNRKNAGSNVYWYTGEFMRIFGDAPVEEVRSAVAHLRRYGATPDELMTLSHQFERKGRLEEAFEIASTTKNPNLMLNLQNVTTAYNFLRQLRGREEASAYLWKEVLAQAPMKDLVLLTLLDTGGFQAFLEEVGEPDSYKYPEYAWLLTLTAWKATNEESDEWRKKIEFHYMNDSGTEPYFSVGLYMLGKLGKEELLGKILTPKQRAEVTYFLGLAERLRGNFEEANVWYQVCTMTRLENNLEYHAARTELYYWAHLGANGRNRLPGDDRAAVRRKSIARDSEMALF